MGWGTIQAGAPAHATLASHATRAAIRVWDLRFAVNFGPGVDELLGFLGHAF